MGGGQVRKVTPAGVVSTLATVSGDGIGVAIGENDTLYTYSYSTGAFNKVDPAGTVTSLGTLPVYGMDLKFLNRDTLYLAGLIANNIYQVSGVTGIYSTLAGSGSAGYLDATGTSAQFYYPSGIVLDGDGYIYVSDNGNNRIRRITKSGVVSTYAGSGTPSTVDGTGTSASFEYPWGINIGYSTGNLYVTENVSGNIRKIVGPKALPLQWLSINASLNQHNKAMLQWQVNEKEVQSYQILKSTNAKDFEPIATITSKGNGVNKYSYVDPQSLYNTTYYRICQTDKSGTQSQSSTMILSPTSQNNDVLKVYPTIVSENIHIESSTDQNIRIVNIMGKEVLQQSIKSEHTIISLQHLAIGIYYLYSSNGSIQMIEKK